MTDRDAALVGRVTGAPPVDGPDQAHVVGPEAVRGGMKLMRTAVLAGIAKKVYDESRKPENRARINAGVAKLRQRRSGG